MLGKGEVFLSFPSYAATGESTILLTNCLTSFLIDRVLVIFVSHNTHTHTHDMTIGRRLVRRSET